MTDMTGKRNVTTSFLLLLMLLTMPAEGMLRGADDTVVDAAAARKSDQGQQQQRIVLDQQMNGIFLGGGDIAQSRQQFLDRRLLQVAALADVCGLMEAQRRKFETAARLDTARTFDGIEAVRQKYAGRTVDLQNPAGQAEWQRFQQDAMAVRTRLQETGGPESLLEKVIAQILDDGQRADWRREVELRRRHQWQNVVDTGMSQFDTALGLTTAQHEAVEKLLMDKPLRVNDAKVRLHGGHVTPYICNICKYALSKLDQQQLKALVNDRQWKTLGTFVEQGRAFAAHLKQQKMIVEEGPAGAGDR
ncbi:MAG: hypothetical protein WCQ77_11595 [Planctomycetota bacterium]